MADAKQTCTAEDTLERLIEGFAHGARGAERTLESVSHVMERVSGLVEENEGLADEVLRSYEQLNLIFEFTQRIATVTSVADIEQHLLSQLGELLGVDGMHLVAPDGTWRSYAVRERDAAFAPDAGGEWLQREIDGVRRSRSLCVASSERGHVLAGPLVRLDERVDAVLALRPAQAEQFTSGEMMLLESILAFGSSVISNSELHERLREMSMQTTRALVAAIDKKDHYTCGHSERVGVLARETGRELGLPESELQVLEWAGLLHDVGKIGIPEEILTKPGALTDEEFEVIKQHPVMGYEILQPITSFEVVLEAVLLHHENADGSGYPRGMTREQTPLFARIIHVVDVFDALSSDRSYRPAFSVEQACGILRKEAGTKLDAEVVNAFLAMFERMRTGEPEWLGRLFPRAQQGGD